MTRSTMTLTSRQVVAFRIARHDLCDRLGPDGAPGQRIAPCRGAETE